MAAIEIAEADLKLPDHQRAVVMLIDAHARDPMGNGAALPEKIRQKLIPGLMKHPTTRIFLAFSGADAIGIAVCFIGFSTFAARPLINIHDLAVLPGQRRSGVGRLLLAAVEREARAMDCCKITLEVLENNHRAIKVYEAAGFSQAVYQEAVGGAIFFAKSL
jgi:ribosomal protein S18 acetylase RimI-like enzyme